MGYDMDIAVFKKESLENMQKFIPEYTFSEIFSDFLFTRLYSDKSIMPDDSEARWLCRASRNIFRDFFEPKLENEAKIIIDECTYKRMYDWLENKLKNVTLLDLVNDEDFDECKVGDMIRVYRNMMKDKIDFETEFIVFFHCW